MTRKQVCFGVCLIFTVVLLMGQDAICGSLSNFEKKIDGVAERILAGVDLKGKVVAVSMIKNSADQCTVLSDMISARIEEDFVNSSKQAGFKVVDRQNLASMMQEWKLGVTGFVDTQSASQIGNLLGIDVFCLGKYTVVGGKYHLRVSLVDAENGQMLGVESEKIKASRKLKKMDAKLVAQPKILPKNNSGLGIKVWTDKTEYHVGEQLKINVELKTNGYVYLIDIDSAGNASLIYPNFYEQNNYLKSGRTHVIPSVNEDFDLKITGPMGIEIVRAIVSSKPIDEVFEVVKDVSSGQPFSEVNIAEVTKKINSILETAKEGEWGEEILLFTIK